MQHVRRRFVPIDGFFEWKATKGKAKQRYAIAIKDGWPFGVASLWENWKSPAGEWARTARRAAHSESAPNLLNGNGSNFADFLE